MYVARRWWSSFVRTSVTLVMIPGVDSLTPPSILLPRRWNLPLADKQMLLHGDLLPKWLLPLLPLLLLLWVKKIMQPKFRKNQQEETRRPHLRPYLGFSRAGGKYRQGWWQKGGQFPSMDGDSNRPNEQSTSPAHRIRTNSASRVALISELPSYVMRTSINTTSSFCILYASLMLISNII